MKTSDFFFDLPAELVAQHPSGKRGEDRLMLLDRRTGNVSHLMMDDLPNLISSDTLMVFNNSRVRRARVYGINEESGKSTEFMFLNTLDQTFSFWNTMVRNARKQKNGMRYRFPDGSVGTVVLSKENEGTEFRAVRFDSAIGEEWFERNGHIPLPPYIKRDDTDEDSERYQNVYATDTGSAACPTAGLHFTEDMLSRLDKAGIERCFVTLHVGLGTFLPVREENIESHKMHSEWYSIPVESAEKINAAKKSSRPVLAVGTTTVRTLESSFGEILKEVKEGKRAENSDFVKAGTSSTSIFMYPGYKFNVVDEMFTNFHTPESTLIMLVSAFAGKSNILSAYKKAVEERYRFFSYGDCMLIK